MARIRGGRRAVPAEARALSGRKRTGSPHANACSPAAASSLGAPPSWMTALQKEIWREGLASAPTGILRKIDASAYQSWVFAAYSLRRAAVQFEAEGGHTVVTTATGNTKANPLLTIIRQESAMMIRCAAELGFTPVARARVRPGSDGDKVENPFAAFADAAAKAPKPN